MQFDDVFLGRRSIRGYKPDPVPKALIKEVLALAMRSPSSMNTQPWNFTVVSGEPLQRIRAGNVERNLAGVPHSREFRIGEAFASLTRRFVSSLLMTACWQTAMIRLLTAAPSPPRWSMPPGLVAWAQ